MTQTQERLPDFLIVGAMKAGTTGLYRDLLTNPAVFMPDRKEPNSLCDDRVLDGKGRAEYAALFSRARPEQVCGEASTAYTKLPDYTGAAERARALLPQDRPLKIIYLLREPVARIISHHYHSFVTGRFGPNIDEEIHRQPALINYSRYAMQITPWIEQFGREHVLLLRFEAYVADRPAVVAQVSRFIGVEPRADLVDPEKVYNKSDGKPVGLPIWRTIRKSRAYRNMIAPLIPRSIRDCVRYNVSPKAPPRPAPPSESTIRFIYQSLVQDLAELQTLCGIGEPLWKEQERTEQDDLHALSH